MKRIAIYLCALAMILSVAGMAQATLYTYNGHWYEDLYGSTWQAVENQAVTNGGHLVTIDDAAEQAWLVSTFGSSPLYFIGMNDIAAEGSWVWSSGDPVAYTNWWGGEPNNAGDEDIAVMNWGAAGFWNDLPTNWAGSAGIAEYNVNPVPEPATLLLMGIGLIGLAGARRKRQ